jgi:hypothetical protein
MSFETAVEDFAVAQGVVLGLHWLCDSIPPLLFYFAAGVKRRRYGGSSSLPGIFENAIGSRKPVGMRF